MCRGEIICYTIEMGKKLIHRLEKTGSFKISRLLVNFWTFIFFAAIIYDFLNHNILAQNEIMLAVAAIYGTFLGIYSAEKEFRRWHHMHCGMHPGEVYVVVWTVLIIGLILADIGFNIQYHMPAEVSASYIAVISILAITRESKNYYKRKKVCP